MVQSIPARSVTLVTSSYPAGNTKEPEPGSLGWKLRRRREALGLTQTELAEKLGWRQTLISRYELGVTTPASSQRQRDLDAALDLEPGVVMPLYRRMRSGASESVRDVCAKGERRPRRHPTRMPTTGNGARIATEAAMGFGEGRMVRCQALSAFGSRASLAMPVGNDAPGCLVKPVAPLTRCQYTTRSAGAAARPDTARTLPPAPAAGCPPA